MKRLKYCLPAVLASLLLTSCLHDDDVVFDEPAAQRLEKSVEHDKQLLESAKNGWVLHLWTGDENLGGGYTYLMKFKDGKVTVASEIAAPSATSTSSYDVIKDMGPVLTVNTFNEIFHSLSTPTMDNDQGAQQDYEFLILRTTNDSIFLKGKKWNNNMVMTRLKDNVDWEQEIAGMKQIASDMVPTFVHVATGNDSTQVNLSEERVLTITHKDKTIEMPFYYTTKGIELLKPVEIDGASYGEFSYDADAMQLTSTNSAGKTITLHVVLPKNYVNYADFAGQYHFAYMNGTVNVTLVPVGDGKHYHLQGLFPTATAVLNYNRALGALEFPSQLIATDPDGSTHWLCAWALADGGSFAKSPKTGFILSRDLSATGFKLKFKAMDGFNADSFVGVKFDTSGDFTGTSTIAAVNGEGRIPFINNMTKF